jgi:two-component system chemotaxis response regulator CheB
MIRVLIVSDSVVTRRVFRQALSATTDIRVVAEAPDPYVARELATEQEPDVVLLDLEMPRMDGISFVRRLTRNGPLPLVVCASDTPLGGKLVLEAFDAGALEAVPRPTSDDSVAELGADWVRGVRAAASARRSSLTWSRRPVELAGPVAAELIAIGAATGGAAALEAVLARLPARTPATVAALPLPPQAARALVARLAASTRLTVEEASEGRVLHPGLLLLAPGNRHVAVVRHGSELRCRVSEQASVHDHRPALDVLFCSVAEACGAAAVGVLLTGFGKDGAQGLLELRQRGAHTIAQDERTALVFGMPRAAIELGAACEISALDEIAPRLMLAVAARRASRAR